MLIALDFDDTYTKDPMLWNMFIAWAIRREHKIIVVTYRYKEWDNEDITSSLPNLDIIYTSGKSKRDITEALGHKVDVWIDDMPECIVSERPGIIVGGR